MGIAIARPIVVGISGASCSGKTWLANHIHRQQPDDSDIVDLDGYYRELIDVDGLEHGHDNPDSIDFERALNDLVRLKSGLAVNLPVYCYEEHRTKGTRECRPKSIVLVEGLFIFAHPALRDEIDLKIWMETDDELRLARRIERDTLRRERTIEEVRERYERDVVPGYRKFIRPLREHADVFVSNEGRDSSIVLPIVNMILAQIGRLSAGIGMS
jgi:uridine kinase